MTQTATVPSLGCRGQARVPSCARHCPAAPRFHAAGRFIPIRAAPTRAFQRAVFADRNRQAEAAFSRLSAGFRSAKPRSRAYTLLRMLECGWIQPWPGNP